MFCFVADCNLVVSLWLIVLPFNLVDDCGCVSGIGFGCCLLGWGDFVGYFVGDFVGLVLEGWFLKLFVSVACNCWLLIAGGC